MLGFDVLQSLTRTAALFQPTGAGRVHLTDKVTSHNVQPLCRSLSAQSSPSFHYVRLNAFVLYRMKLSFSHLIYFMLPKANYHKDPVIQWHTIASQNSRVLIYTAAEKSALTYTASPDWILQLTECVFAVRYKLNTYIQFRLINHLIFQHYAV